MRAIAPKAGIALDVFAAVPGIETAPDSDIAQLERCDAFIAG